MAKLRQFRNTADGVVHTRGSVIRKGSKPRDQWRQKGSCLVLVQSCCSLLRSIKASVCHTRPFARREPSHQTSSYIHSRPKSLLSPSCLYWFFPCPFPCAAFDRSARASRRLNLASWMTPVRLCQLLLLHIPTIYVEHTCISIGAEVASPLHKGAASVLAGCDLVATDRADD